MKENLLCFFSHWIMYSSKKNKKKSIFLVWKLQRHFLTLNANRLTAVIDATTTRGTLIHQEFRLVAVVQWHPWDMGDLPKTLNMFTVYFGFCSDFLSAAEGQLNELEVWCDIRETGDTAHIQPQNITERAVICMTLLRRGLEQFQPKPIWCPRINIRMCAPPQPAPPHNSQFHC